MNKLAKGEESLVEMTPEMTRQYQLFLLDMYRDVKAVCDKYRIPLFLIGGSALGAVRHEGFIPWDDDLDLLMTRRHYRRFQEVFEEELGDKYILNAPNYGMKSTHRFPRILKKGTYYRKMIDGPDEELHCIYLDLFLLENMPDNKILRRIKGLYAQALAGISWEVFIYENNSPQVKDFLLKGGKAGYYVRIIIGKVFSFLPAYKWFNLCDKANQWPDDHSKYMCIATGRKRYFGEVFRRDQFLPGRKAIFEGETVRLFSDLDPYLRNLYGDYMQLPPEEERERHLTREFRFKR